MPEFTPGYGRSRYMTFIIAALVVLVLIGIGRFWFGLNSRPNPSLYQGVFLTNGQLYFGKLSFTKTHYVLRDVYYIQTSQTPQPKPGDREQNRPETKLVKLGEEVHGPEDAMFIEKDSVLYWENLKADGKVAQTIAQHKAQPSTPLPAPAAAPAAVQ